MLQDVAAFGEFRPLANCNTEFLLNHVNADWKALFTNLSIGIELISILSYCARQRFNVLARLYRHSTLLLKQLNRLSPTSLCYRKGTHESTNVLAFVRRVPFTTYLLSDLPSNVTCNAFLGKLDHLTSSK